MNITINIIDLINKENLDEKELENIFNEKIKQMKQDEIEYINILLEKFNYRFVKETDKKNNNYKNKLNLKDKNNNIILEIFMDNPYTVNYEKEFEKLKKNLKN